MSLHTHRSELAAKWASLLQARRTLTEAETADLQRWLLADPAHADALGEACYIMNAVDAFSAQQRAEILALPEEQPSQQQPEAAPTRPQPRWRAYAIAASALFATMLGLLWFVAEGEGWLPQTYRTGTGELRMVLLPDGSVVQLSAKTTVRWTGLSSERRMELVAGQALFQVVHDPAHPFYVRTDSGLVRVLGTQFDLNRRRDATILTVLEGTVDVLHTGEHADNRWHRVVHANQRLTYGATGLIDDVRQVDASKAVRWREFALEIDKEPLSAVIEEISRYTDQSILLGDDRLKTQRIIGTLRVRDIREALRDMENLAPVVVRKDGAAFVLDLRTLPHESTLENGRADL